MFARFALLLMFLVPMFVAAEDEEKTRQTVAMSQPVYEGLRAAQELIEAKNYGQGLTELKKLRDMSDLSPYETAQIWNLTAYAYYLKEDYKRAINAYSTVLKQEDLPSALRQSTLKTLAQLYFTVERYKAALGTVDQLIAEVGSPSADIYMLKGQAHFQLEQYRDAVQPIKQGIDLYREQGKTPRENWLLLLRVCYYELSQFNNMIGVLNELIKLYPKDRYVLTLAGVYSELGNTKRQLALTEALYEDNRLTDGINILNLANLYLVHGLPFKAAKLIDREVAAGRMEKTEKNLRLLSQSWYQAREDEKAIAPLAQAAAMSGDGELYVRLAQSYINLENWEKAAEAVTQGLKKGGVRRQDTANIMLGMALFNQRKLEAAKKAFSVAVKDKRSAKAARQWLAYVDSELTRESTFDQKLPEQRELEQDAILKNL